MKITRHCLRVRNPLELVDFYGTVLGMRNYGDRNHPMLGYHPGQCLLELTGGAVKDYHAEPDALYWKIGITLRDLDTAVNVLRDNGHAVSDPQQFRNIGYMSHLRDPQGFDIELLQQGFEGHATDPGRGHPVGGQATLAHITLRVNDIAAARAHCEGRLGMRLLSVQPIPDLEAVENREWLWSRPYALLEMQHIYAGGVKPAGSDEEQAGFAGFAWQSSISGAHNYVPTYVMNEWL
jgi:predicted enzyme related to lactoylglutathione lyase